MRVERSYVSVEGEAAEWRRRLTRLLGCGMRAHLMPAGDPTVPRCADRGAVSNRSEEAQTDSDNGRLVDEITDSEG